MEARPGVTMNDRWISSKLYQHPAAHRKGTWGYVELSPAGIYVLRQGNVHISCPQGWAAAIHAEETQP